MEYRHRQVGWTWFVMADALIIVAVVLLVTLGGDGAIAAGILVFVAAVLVIASVLTVTVDAHGVTAAFLTGWPRHRIALDDIASATPTVNKKWWGWGIRKIPGGWMYNVWGVDAVEIERRSGTRFRIGTDEPEALAAAIDDARS